VANKLARIFHKPGTETCFGRLRDGQVLAWLRQTVQFDPQSMNNTYPVGHRSAAVVGLSSLPGKHLPSLATMFMKYPG
jgi:hypothetical protein